MPRTPSARQLRIGAPTGELAAPTPAAPVYALEDRHVGDKTDRRISQVAWAEALEAAARAVYSHLGWPEGSGNDNVAAHAQVAWEAAAAFAAGMLAFAQKAQRHGLDWPQVVRMAQDEQREIGEYWARQCNKNFSESPSP